MTESKRVQLSANMLACNYTVKTLLAKISALEADQQLSIDEKLVQIKKIKEEITKVGTEIDSIKKEIILLNSYDVN